MKRKRLTLIGGLAGMIVLSGCSFDGDPGFYAGVGLGVNNMEATVGKNAGESPSRHPDKYRRNMSWSTQQSSEGPFRRD